MDPEFHRTANAALSATQVPGVMQPSGEAVGYVSARALPNEDYGASIRNPSPPISDTTLSDVSDFDTCLNETCYPRPKTVQNLANLLDRNRIVFVCGPPLSGKTTLARLLEEYYRHLGSSVVYLNEWKNEKSDPVSHLCDLYNEQNKDLPMRPESFAGSSAIFLMDNAQNTYSDFDFWLKLIKPLNAKRPKLRLCLFASYGNPVTGIDSQHVPKRRAKTKLSRFDPLQRVSPIRPRFASDEHPQLYFDREEFEAIVSNICLARSEGYIEFMPATLDCLFTLTSGHPGVTDAVLAWIISLELHRRSRGETTGPKKEVTAENLVAAMRCEAHLFAFLKDHAISRSLADTDNAGNPHVRGALRNFRYRHTLDLSIPAGRYCYEQGWMYTEVVDKDGKKLVWRFPSKVHDKFVEFNRLDFRFTHSTTFGRHFGFNQYKDLPSLCKAVLSQITASDLMWYKEADAYGNVRPPVDMFKLHFYTSLIQVGVEIPVTTKWSEVFEPNEFDFVVAERGWGIRLMFYDEDSENSDENPQSVQARLDWKNPLVKESILLIFSMSDATELTKSLTPEENAAIWHVVLKTDFFIKDIYVAHGENVFG